MGSRNTKRSTLLFLGVFLLAGISNALTFTGVLYFQTLMAEFNYLSYVGLLLFWIQSVRSRLLPSRERIWMTGAAWMMLFYQLLRTFKYRFAFESSVMRYLIYLYFVPMTLIPTLFLMTCLRIRRGSRESRPDETLLLLPWGLLTLMAVTNDLHKLVYVPKVALSEFVVDGGTYTYGPVFYLLYIWMILSFALGLTLLIRETARKSGKALRSLLCVAAVWFCLLLSFNLFHHGIYGPRMYNSPEIHIFGMLGILEVCIRHRLIPNNANYANLFTSLQMPALVTDQAFRPVYRSGEELGANANQLRAALASPVYMTPDLLLSGKPVRGGYAFWVKDESEVHQAQERLAEANELIESENTLIRAEAEQREKNAWLQSQHRIYHEIAEVMYPVQQRIEHLLNQMAPGTSAFRDQLAHVSVLNAFVKRKTNLLLLAAEKDFLTSRDLFLALEESAVYLSLAGLKTNVLRPDEERFPSDRVIALYDAFEGITEQLIGQTSALMVSFSGSTLILAAEAVQALDLKSLPVPLRTREEEGILYMDFFAEKGGEEA